MALTFFWRCEGTTLDGTNDYSAGDTTATLVGTSALSASGQRVGTNGIYTADGVTGYYNFSPTGIVAAGSSSVGSLGFSWRCSGTPGDGYSMAIKLGSTTYCDILTAGSGRFKVRMNHSTGGVSDPINLSSGTGFSPNTWGGIILRWDIPNDAMRLELYDAAGTLINSGNNAIGDLSNKWPDTISIISIGKTGGSAQGAVSIDNVMFSGRYNESLQNNFGISSYQNYTSLTQKLKFLILNSAASQPDIKAAVYSAPSGANITGTTKYGEVASKSFESNLEGGKAVLKIPLSEIGNPALAAGATAVAVIKGTTLQTEFITGTVIEE